MTARHTMALAALALICSLSGCTDTKPEPIAYDVDACAYCRMQISDPRFGAELVTAKGRTLKFDSIDCLVAYYRQAAAAHDVASVWVSNTRFPGHLIDATRARYIDLGAGRASMGRVHGWAAVEMARDAIALGVTDTTALKHWSDLL